MKKYVVETYYTCTFKTVHTLDNLDDVELSKIDKRSDGDVEVIDVKLNNRKTKKIGGIKDEKLNNSKLDDFLPNNISNQINTDPSRNSFVAEYSFLLPSFNNTTNSTTNLTPNFTSTADQDLHDYLGLPPRNNATQTNSVPSLPPLPEDNENDIFEETQFISDDEDL